MSSGIYIRSEKYKNDLSNSMKEKGVGFQKGYKPWNKGMKTGYRSSKVGENISKAKLKNQAERIACGEPPIAWNGKLKENNYKPYFCECGCGQICSQKKRYAHGHNQASENKKEKAKLQLLGNKLRFGKKPWNYMKKLGPQSESTKQKRILSMSKYPISGDGYFYNTPSEIEMKRCLNENGIKYDFQFFVGNINHPYYADFYLPLYNIILEVDGDIHNSKNSLDETRTKELEEIGYRVLRFENNKFDSRSVWREI